MAPAVECMGCNLKIKTAHEPAKEKEMTSLISEINLHSGTEGARMTALDTIITLRRFQDRHLTDYNYYEKTPKKGFENAKVV